MNLWINIKRDALMATLKEVGILLINDTEAKLLTGENSLVLAARKILTYGPRSLVIKHGEYGATIFFGDGSHPFRAPALPIAEVQDPTGAGDTFAGGFMGYIASQPKLTRSVLKSAMFYGGVMGSFTVERFGPERLLTLTRAEIEERFKLFISLTHLD
jgi:sugar/nucleoside kinase (ribokinase family)